MDQRIELGAEKISMSIIIRPVDPNNNPALHRTFNQPSWIMGEDMSMDVNPLLSIKDLRGEIEKEKCRIDTDAAEGSHVFVSRHRMQLRVNGKAIVPSKENWTLRRFGVYEGMILQVNVLSSPIAILILMLMFLQVEPTISGDWYWHPFEYYEDQFMEKVLRSIRSSSTMPLSLSELGAMVGALPPPLRHGDLKAFLRRYPEKVHLLCDSSGFASEYWVRETPHPFAGPIFCEFPADVGCVRRFDPAPFDWEAYQDVDDMLKEETWPPPKLKERQRVVGDDGEEEEEEEGENGDDEWVREEVAAVLEELLDTLASAAEDESGDEDSDA